MTKRKGFLSNDSLKRTLTQTERDARVNKIRRGTELLLEGLGIDFRNDHNTRDTPNRVARMYVDEICSGLFKPMPKITEFENVRQYNQLILVGPITVRSMCAHHLLPFLGTCYVGVLPNPKNNRLIGLSKYSRIVEYYSSRLQIQEELVHQIADDLQHIIKPQGLAVRMICTHMCAIMRGVREHGMRMDSTAMKGVFITNSSIKQEFIQACNSMIQLQGNPGM